MPFLYADAFFASLDYERILSIKGAPGAGKTFMAFELAEYYLARKDHYRLHANVRNIWEDPLQDEADVEHSVFILDEGGRYLREWKYFGDLFAFPRKFDTYILIPSRKIPHADLAQFICKPFIPFQKIIGVPLTIWTWKFDDGDEISGGWFIHYFDPSRFGVYDTKDLSEDPTGLIEWFGRAIDKRQAEYGRDKVSGMARTGTDSEEAAAIAERMAGAARRIAALQNARRR